MLYQVNFISNDGDTRHVVKTVVLDATDTRNAWEQAEQAEQDNARKEKRDTIPFMCYPLATIDNGEQVDALAAYVVRSYERWERRNNAAIMNPWNRTPETRADLRQTAALAIIETLTADASANMDTVEKSAFRAVASLMKQMDRNSEREYNPAWVNDNLAPRFPRSTFPALDKLVKSAVVSAGLTDEQADIMLMYVDGISTRNIADIKGVNDRTARGMIARALLKVIRRMVEIDGDTLPTFTAAGYTAADIAEKLDTLKKRAAR